MAERNIIMFNERMHVPELERRIAQVAQEQTMRARSHAQSLADRQLPMADATDRLEDYFGSTTSVFNGLMAEADTQIGASVCIAEGKDVINRAGAEEKQVDQQLADLRSERTSTKTERDKIPAHDTDRTSMVKAQVAVAFISGGEMVFNAFAFSLFTANLIFALVLSAGFWLALHGGAYGIPWVVCLPKTRTGKIAVAAGCFAFFAGLFFWLGTLRLSYATEAGSTWEGVSPFGFMLLNLFLFGTCVFLIHQFLPAKQVRKEIRERHRWDGEYQACERKIKTLEERKLSIEQEKKEKLGTILKRMAYSAQIEALITEKYREVFEVFKQESILRLRRVAPCLRESPKPLNGFAPEFETTPRETVQ